jgi:hypothetical protein
MYILVDIVFSFTRRKHGSRGSTSGGDPLSQIRGPPSTFYSYYL